MGPRPCGRGNPGLTAATVTGGTGFNGAAALRPRKSWLRYYNTFKYIWLQWGRGLAAAEMHFCVASCTKDTPLQWGRGLAAAEMAAMLRKPKPEYVSFNGAAALRPRKSARFDRSKRKTLRFNGAAALRPRKSRSPAKPHRWRAGLQWGRGLAAAEMPWRSGCCAKTTTRFNGAAALRPRKSSMRDCDLVS